jgi:hypothetical protein
MDMPFDDAWALIEKTALHAQRFSNSRSSTQTIAKKSMGIYEINANTHKEAQNSALIHEIAQLRKQVGEMSLSKTSPAEASSSSVVCQICGVSNHTALTCQLYTAQPMEVPLEEANYVKDGYRVQNPNPRNDPYSQTYNPGWRNHPNFRYDNNTTQPPQPQYQNPAVYQAPNQPVYQAPYGARDGAPPGYQARPPQIPPVVPKKSPELIAMENMMNEMRALTNKVQALEQAQKMTETQVAQNATNAPRPLGVLPGHPDENPKGQVSAVSLRSGKQLQAQEEEPMKAKEVTEPVIPVGDDGTPSSPAKEKEVPYVPPPPYVPPLPFPQRKNQAVLEKKYGKFLEVLKKLHINIPFTDALKEMPSYVKFLKEILSNKRKLDECHMVSMNRECSALIQNKLPPKLQDPGSFCIPINVGAYSYNALCDLGASVSLLPLSICEKLGLKDLRPVKMQLYMADRSIAHPAGILEDIPIRVGKFYVPVDFVVLDIKADSPIPIILGRPFLATASTMINVKDGILSFTIGEERIELIFQNL